MLVFRKILRAYWMDDPIPQSFAILTWAYFYWGWFRTRFITTATLIFGYYVVNKPRKGKRYLTYYCLIYHANLYRIYGAEVYKSWGWSIVGNNLLPVWSTILKASVVCTELTPCNCKKQCSGKCKCSKANLRCKSLFVWCTLLWQPKRTP